MGECVEGGRRRADRQLRIGPCCSLMHSAGLPNTLSHVFFQSGSLPPHPHPQPTQRRLSRAARVWPVAPYASGNSSTPQARKVREVASGKLSFKWSPASKNPKAREGWG